MRPHVELDLPVNLDRSGGGPLHSQLAHVLRAAVATGLLAPASRLPPSRLLAAQLGVARGTVLAAYDQLSGEGCVESRHGSGTYVSAYAIAHPGPRPGGDPPGTRPVAAAAAAPPGVGVPAGPGQVDLRPGRPDTTRLVDGAWRSAWRRAAGGPVPDDETSSQGLGALREQVVAHLAAARGLRADPEHVFVTAGTGDGLALVVQALGAPATDVTVAVEDPGYPAARRVLTRLGAPARAVPVDGDGLLVEALAALAEPPRVALVTPSHQYPLGGCLPVGRRRALLDWARLHDAVVVEDDYDSEFRFGLAPLPALAGLDHHERVVHLGTFSKVLTPWLRMGYLLAPPRLVPAIHAVRADLGTPVSGMDQQALAHYLATGALRRHIARVRRDYGHRRRHLTRLLAAHPHLSLRGTRAGLHVVIDLPAGAVVPILLGALAARGLLLADLAHYAATPGAASVDGPAVVLGYGGATLAELDRAVAALAEATR